MKALVIEDNPVDLKLLCAVLDSGGYELIPLTVARGAVEQIRERQPDVIVIDLNLPDCNGLDVVRAIRADTDIGDLPILAITAYWQLFPRLSAARAGCSAWMQKPFDTRQLVRQVDVLIRGAG